MSPTASVLAIAGLSALFILAGHSAHKRDPLQTFTDESESRTEKCLYDTGNEEACVLAEMERSMLGGK